MPALPPSRRKVLFFDWRDFECGHLAWRTADGQALGVGGDAGPDRDLHATPVQVPHGVRLQAQPATRTEPVDDWKGWGRIIYHEGRYRSFYLEIDGNAKLGSGSASQRAERQSVTVCSTASVDGVAWSAPTRCAVEVPGHYGFDGVCFFVDPVAAAAERYRLVYCARVPDALALPLHREYLARHPRYQDERVLDRPGPCLMSLTSPDGVHWSACPTPLLMHPSDTDTTVYWDAALGRYVMYTRMYRQARRWIGRAEAADLFHWGPIEPVVWPRLDDPPDHDFYLNGRTAYPGLDEYQLLFPMVYHRFTERSDIRLYASSDGIAWNPVPGGPVLQPGPAGAWDSEFIGSGKDLLPFGPGRVAMPYTGTRYPHKYPRFPAVWAGWRMAWAWWPTDRLAAVVADREGEFWTTAMRPAGATLRLNCRTVRGGEIRVGLAGVAGRAVADADPLHGDHAAAPVTWRGSPDPGLAADQPVRLHLRLRAAEVFALEWV
jgi:hypothetical protein